MFDGLGTALIGVVTALLGLWLTLRHDRALAAEERRHDRALAVEERFQADCREVLLATRELRRNVDRALSERRHFAAPGSDEFEVYRAWYDDVLWIRNRAVMAEEQALVDLLDAVCDRLGRHLHTDEVAGAIELLNDLGVLGGLLRTRVTHPDRFKKMSDEEISRWVGAIERGDTINL